MPFVDSAREAVHRLPRGDRARVALEYLLQHALGRHNAKPWPQLEAQLNAQGIFISREEFQQTIVADSRAGDIFIGSIDHGPGRGYFIIQDRADADVAREFYSRRIAAQQANLDRLDALIQRHQYP